VSEDRGFGRKLPWYAQLVALSVLALFPDLASAQSEQSAVGRIDELISRIEVEFLGRRPQPPVGASCPARLIDLTQRMNALASSVRNNIDEVDTQANRYPDLRRSMRNGCSAEGLQISSTALSVLGRSQLQRYASELGNLAVCAVQLGSALRSQRPIPPNLVQLSEQLNQHEQEARKLEDEAATADERAKRRLVGFGEYQSQCR